MAAEFKVVVKDAAGIKQAELVGTAYGGFLSLAYARQVNGAGLIRFTVDADSEVISLLELDGQIEVWRRDQRNGIPWSCEMTGLYRTPRYQPDPDDESGDDLSDSNDLFVATCPGVLHLLSRRHNAYYANTANRSVYRSVAVETIMRSLVVYNCTASATTDDGRIRTPAPLPISVETSQGRGGTIDRGNSGVNVLAELQELAALSGLDFDLVRTTAAAWVFRVYSVLGTDKSATVTLSPDNGSLAVLTYERDTIEEKTVAIVAGAGEENLRQFAVRTGANYSTAQDIETWVDARSTNGGADALNSEGDEALLAAQATEHIDYRVLQAPGALYGLHYTLGDLVTVSYRGISSVQQVSAVTVSLDGDGEEIIDVELRQR